MYLDAAESMLLHDAMEIIEARLKQDAATDDEEIGPNATVYSDVVFDVIESMLCIDTADIAFDERKKLAKLVVQAVIDVVEPYVA